MKTLLFVLLTFICSATFAQGKFFPILYTDTNKVHEHVETEVEFPGGKTALNDFISKNVKYPESAKKELLQGTVIIQADVDVRGQVSNARVKGFIQDDLDKEALRLVNAFPKLKPATIYGKPVRALARFAIEFIHPEAGTKKVYTEIVRIKEEEVTISAIAEDEEVVTENIKVVDEPRVYSFVEQMPEFLNGDKALQDTITKNLIYPEQERRDSIVGKVMIKFIVDETGKVMLPTVVRGVSPGLDKEALRVVSNLPRFKPGRQQGKPVKVYYSLPVVFRL